MKPLKTKVTVSLDPDLLWDLKLLADDENRPLSNYINNALLQHIQLSENTEKINHLKRKQ